MVETAYTNYAWIYNEARKNYLKKWTLSKTIIRTSKEGEIIEEVTTEEIAQPKIAFLNIMLNSQKSMEDIIDGRSQNVSVALLSQRFMELERELDETNQYKSKYEKLRSSKHIQD
jgi:chorismate-pyruvate lyase